MATETIATRDWVITKVLNKLRRKDYNLKFRREADCLYCFQLQDWIMPEDFTVDEYYYFEDLLNPDAERILFAISLPDGLKGFLIDSCNVYADNISPDMLLKLKLNKIISRKNELTNAGRKQGSFKLFNEALTF